MFKEKPKIHAQALLHNTPLASAIPELHITLPSMFNFIKGSRKLQLLYYGKRK